MYLSDFFLRLSLEGYKFLQEQGQDYLAPWVDSLIFLFWVGCFFISLAALSKFVLLSSWRRGCGGRYFLFEDEKCERAVLSAYQPVFLPLTLTPACVFYQGHWEFVCDAALFLLTLPEGMNTLIDNHLFPVLAVWRLLGLSARYYLSRWSVFT